MSENLQEGTDSQEPQYTPTEQKALDMGWKPKSEFTGNEEDFVDAKEFIGRQQFFDKISHQSREIKELRNALESFKTHYNTVREVEYERALATLKNSRKEALREGDADKFDALDDEIKTVERQAAAIREQKAGPTPSQPPAEFQEWVSQNPWYNSTKYMREFADELGLRLHSEGMPPAKVLREVEKAVKNEFPQKFRNQNKDDAPNVESGASGTTRRASKEPVLSEQEKRIMDTLVRGGHITKEKYLADLKAAKGE